MAPVTYDNSSESHTGITGSVSEAQFEWQHSPVDTPRGLVVYVVGSLDATDIITSVTYGGVPMNAVTGGLAQDTSGDNEPGTIQLVIKGQQVAACRTSP